ncbi:MAG: YdiU family protein [Pseudomonadota bacterium]
MTQVLPLIDHPYAALPARLRVAQAPVAVAAPRLLALNEGLLRDLGLDADALASSAGVAALAGNAVPTGAAPVALAYAGHQFGGWVPQLGDGRAILLGGLRLSDGTPVDLQLKGAGRTPFSRGGDGRAALGPVLREYLIGEAMAALGIPTTRALAAVATGETVQREVPLPGAILARIARSHLRVGSFQYAAARRDTEALQALAGLGLALHPGLDTAADLLRAVVDAQARLVAAWMGVGFIHGVMNTDNMAISGETIDYGPCAFLDVYHPDTVFSSIDQFGRYAYRNQPGIAQWNLAQLATCLLPLIGAGEAAVEEAQAIIDGFPDAYQNAWRSVFRAKLGLRAQQPEDADFVLDFLGRMAAAEADFTNTFRALAETADDAPLPPGLAADIDGLESWRPIWHARLAREGGDPAARAGDMKVANPAIIPRNHQVEAALSAATDGDLAPFHALNAALATPFDAPAESPYRASPHASERVHATFCGT